MPLDNILNRDILNSLSLNWVLRHFVLYGERNNDEERIIGFSFSTPKEITREIKSITESKMGTTSSARIIKDFDLVLKALEIVFCENGAAV